MLHTVVLSLALAAPALPPEAARRNAEAMRFYDAGELAPAVDEFLAAYQALPDARRDLAGREQLMGSMRSTLLELYAATGDPAPLCRLQGLLRDHADALAAAFPGDPDKLETRSARARHEEVTRQLAALGPEVCAPPPPLLPVTTRRPEVVTPAPDERRAEDAGARRLLVAGGVVLPIGLAALAGLGAVAVRYRGELAEADALHAELAARRCTDDDRARMRELASATRRDAGLMIALGLTGAALVTTGAALLVRGGSQRRRARLGLDVRRGLVGLTIAGEF